MLLNHIACFINVFIWKKRKIKICIPRIVYGITHECLDTHTTSINLNWNYLGGFRELVLTLYQLEHFLGLFSKSWL